MANKVKWGIRNVHYATRTVSGTPEAVTYGTPVAIPGAVNISLSPEGDNTPFYADDIEYFRVMANNGYTGTLEMALLPAAFRELALGEALDQGSVLVENADKQGKEFALGFEIQGNDKNILVWMYNVVASRPDVNASTKEAAATPETETLNIVVRPEIGGNVMVRTTDATADGTKNSWFSTVYVEQ